MQNGKIGILWMENLKVVEQVEQEQCEWSFFGLKFDDRV